METTERDFLYFYNILNKLNQSFKGRDRFELSVGELGVIHVIEASEAKALHISQICELTGIARPSITPILRDLENRGLIRRITDSEDGRRYLVALTKKFYDSVEADEKQRMMLFKEFIEMLDKEELRTFSNIISCIDKIAEKYSEMK